jgi:hypothetical protein
MGHASRKIDSMTSEKSSFAKHTPAHRKLPSIHWITPSHHRPTYDQKSEHIEREADHRGEKLMECDKTASSVAIIIMALCRIALFGS